MLRWFLSGPRIAALSLAAALSAAPAAAEPVKVGLFQIPHFVESADEGIFVDFTKEVARRAGVEIAIEVFPGARAVNEFEAGKVGAIAPVMDIVMPGEFHRSATLFQKNDYAFTPKGQPAIGDLAELKGKLVGVTQGYVYPDEVMKNPDVKVEPAPTDVLNMKKLGAGRLQAFIVEEQSGLAAAAEAGVADQVEKGPKPLYSLDVFYAFPKTPAGEANAAAFTKAIEAMVADGTLQKMLAPPGK